VRRAASGETFEVSTETTNWCPNMLGVLPADNLAPRMTRFFDAGLVGELAQLLQGMSVGVCGYSSEQYVRRLTEQGLECELFGPYSNGPSRSHDEIYFPDIANMAQFQKRYDGVICLGVGERLFSVNRDNVLRYLARHATKAIVLSWAVSKQAGDGHLNPRSNFSVIYRLWKLGFRINARTTLLVRSHCSVDALKPGLMVFSRGKAPRSFAERRAVRRIVGADIERLKANNRNNSSLVNAIVGKAVRLILSAQKHATNVANRLRVLSYDTTRFLRKPPRRAMDSQTGGGTHFFHPVCFTCGKHFRFVRLALISLGKCEPRIKQIYIYMDKGDPLSIAECEQLRTESQYPISFRLTKYPMSSWGPKVQLSELRAYREIAKQMSAGDFLVKFDSDVLFLSNKIFQFVANSKAASIGTHVSKLHDSEGQEEYMQGGCYFIGAKELCAIISIPVASSTFAPTKWGEIPEDQFFSSLLRRCGAKPLYNDFLYFDPVFIASGTEDNQLDAALQAIPSTAGVLHFEGNQWDKVDRSNMRRTADRLFGPLPPTLNPYPPETARKNRPFSIVNRVPASR
jgi:hypothetical protein